MVHRTDSAFIAFVTLFPFPTKFRMPQVESYNGSKDLLDHLESFKTLMHLQGVVDEILCRAFPTTLKGLARVWFSKLTPNSISTFKELSDQFASHFIGGHRYKKSTACLMNIKQREDETLRSYIPASTKRPSRLTKLMTRYLWLHSRMGYERVGFCFLYTKTTKRLSLMYSTGLLST